MSVTATEDIVTGASRYLRGFPEVVNAVDTFTITGTAGASSTTPGIWPYRLWTRMEGSQKTSIVVAREGGWAAANTHNTLRFPRLVLNVWADPLRDGQNNNVDPRVQSRANACFEIADKYLHLTGGPERWFGDIRVVSCVRLTEPVIYDVADGDGLVRLQAYYAVTQG